MPQSVGRWAIKDRRVSSSLDVAIFKTLQRLLANALVVCRNLPDGMASRSSASARKAEAAWSRSRRALLVELVERPDILAIVEKVGPGLAIDVAIDISLVEIEDAVSGDRGRNFEKR